MPVLAFDNPETFATVNNPISDIDVFQYAFSRKVGLRLASERPVVSRDDLHEKCSLVSCLVKHLRKKHLVYCVRCRSKGAP